MQKAIRVDLTLFPKLCDSNKISLELERLTAYIMNA